MTSITYLRAKCGRKNSRKWGRLKMTSLKFPSFSDASIANFEQVFVSWCFTISVTVIKKLNCKKHSLICNNVTAQKIKFSIKDFLNVTKSAGNCGFGHIY